MKKILFILLFTVNLFSNDIFLLPDDSNIVKEKLNYEILTAKESIFVSMYNFSYQKIAKDLIKASENGVKVTVLLDKTKVKSNDKVYKLLKESNITVVFDENIKKMHLKTILIDNKLAIIGSLNFTKKSFEDNYDLIYFSKDRKLLEKLKEFRAKFE